MLSATNGFAANFPMFYQELQEVRRGDRPLYKGLGKKKARDISLREFLKVKAPDIGVGHVYAECGIDPHTDTFDDLLNDPNGKYLVCEAIRDAVARGFKGRSAQFSISSEAGQNTFIRPQSYETPIMEGAIQGAYYPELCIRETTVPQPAHTMPYFTLTDQKMTVQTEGSTIVKGGTKTREKTVILEERGRGVDISYSALRYNTIDLLSIYFQQVGMVWADDLNREFTLALLNGDNSGAEESAAVIGVLSPSNGFTWSDFIDGWTRMYKMGCAPTAVVGSESEIAKLQKLSEFKDRRNAGPLLTNLRFRTPRPEDVDVYISESIPSDHIGFVDTTKAMVQLTSMPLMIESDRIISKRIEEHIMTATTGPAIILRYARLFYDTGNERTPGGSNDFPVWFNSIR